jgi:hypothetical protein
MREQQLGYGGAGTEEGRRADCGQNTAMGKSIHVVLYSLTGQPPAALALPRDR